MKSYWNLCARIYDLTNLALLERASPHYCSSSRTGQHFTSTYNKSNYSPRVIRLHLQFRLKLRRIKQGLNFPKNL